MQIIERSRLLKRLGHLARARGPCHVLLFLHLLMLGCASDTKSTMLTPTTLRCEYKSNPLGIDQTAPRFDWQFGQTNPDARNLKQSAYQIIVATTQEKLAGDQGDLWDTGIVKSDETAQIAYAGKPLTSELRAYWKVRTWDAAGKASDWSTPAMFSMGLLKPADWKAKWIGYDATPATAPARDQQIVDSIALTGLKWIWYPENPAASEPAAIQAAPGTHLAPGSFPQGSRYFRKVINLPAGKITNAAALLSADQRFELSVNGSACGFGTDAHRAWPIDLTPYFHAGDNLIAIAVRHDRPGAAGLTGRFNIDIDNQPAITVDLDTSWKCSNEKSDHWDTMIDAADQWPEAKEIAAVGDQPLGTPKPRTLELPPPPYLRKQISLDKPVARATIYASALGLYELHLNGERVGKDDFTPGWTEYHKRVHYQTYDVTAIIHRGQNAIGATLADGWYAGYFGFSGRRDIYGDKPRLIAQLNVEYTDGSRETFATDESWSAAYGPIREADLLMGCAYDARHEMPGWDAVGIDASHWEPVAVSESEPVKLQASPGPTVQALEELPARSIKEPLPGVHVFDLGQNMVGWVRLKLATQPGETIQLRYSEMLNSDGTLYTPALRGARATDTYISQGGDIVWEPKFTFHGFRYVEVSGVNKAPSAAAITGIVARSALQRTGEFECSNKLVNQLVQNIIWGQKGNYFEIPTDCPQRDERLGWTGDAQFFVPTATYNFDVASFFNKWLVDLCEDSANPEGAFGSVAPNVIQGKNSFGATAWADAGIVCPYTIWKVYGDTRVISDHYGAMAKYIDYLTHTSDNLIRTQGAYGDWLNLGGGAKSEVIGTAYFEHVTRLMSEMADAIGKAEDAQKYRELADKILLAFINNFIDSDGHIKQSSQTGYALAFAFNLIPQDLRPKAADAFVSEIEKKDWHLATGFIGTPRLLPALSAAGRDDVAYRLLQQETFPGWLFQVKLGATTMWERWDGWTPDKGFQDPGMNSFNHYAFGSVGEWLYRTAGGIDTDGAGYKQIIVRPQPGGDMTYAKASYNSIHGRIESSWKLQKGKLLLDVTIPPNTTATIDVPTRDPKTVVETGGAKASDSTASTAVYKVGSGRYHFTAAW